MNYLRITEALIITRCLAFFEENGIDDPFSKSPDLKRISSALTDEDMKLWAKGEAEAERDTFSDLRIERYFSLLKLFKGDNVLRSLLDLCMADLMHPALGALISYHLGSPVCLHAAFLLEGIPDPEERDILTKAEKASVFCHIERTGSPLQYAPVRIDDRLMAYLEGSDEINPCLSPFTDLFVPGGREAISLNPPYIHKSFIDNGYDFFNNGGQLLLLSGRGGRRFIAKHISLKLDMPFLFLNLPDFMREAKKDIAVIRSALVREAGLLKAGICFYGITEDYLKASGSSELTRLGAELLSRMLLEPVLSSNIPLILCTDVPCLFSNNVISMKSMLEELPEELSFDERYALWQGFKDLYSLPADPSQFAMRYHLNASETSRIVSSFLEKDKVEDYDPDTLFSKLTLQQTKKEEDPLGRIVYSKILLDDVKIQPHLREKLDDVITSVRQSHRILDEWNLRKNYPYGRSVSLLLSGPPGTGKTMTANAIAGELKMPLYQVNLSHIVDKYIGETEKNLEKAFSFAEKTNSVLFFDEADALFGKRSEVKDSHDKYANTEISYLLQRIEAYDGIVVLATNIKGNIDPAFLRRIRYVVNFENPDENARLAIWESCITEDIPKEDIDTAYLASQFKDFTGSTIKSVFLNSCAIASGKGEKLGMIHIIHAVKAELEKTTTVAFTNDALGKYAYLA